MCVRPLPCTDRSVATCALASGRAAGVCAQTSHLGTPAREQVDLAPVTTWHAAAARRTSHSPPFAVRGWTASQRLIQGGRTTKQARNTRTRTHAPCAHESRSTASRIHHTCGGFGSPPNRARVSPQHRSVNTAPPFPTRAWLASRAGDARDTLARAARANRARLARTEAEQSRATQ